MLMLLSSGCRGGWGGGNCCHDTFQYSSLLSAPHSTHSQGDLGAFSVYCILNWETARSLHELGQYLASLQRSLANMLSKRLP